MRKVIIFDILKYFSIGDAQKTIVKLEHKLQALKIELDDINSDLEYSLNSYSTNLMMLDYFFDNVFTDLRVSRKIINDQETLIQLRKNICAIIADLDNKNPHLDEL